MGTYTIGFLGHFVYAKRICDYMDTLLLRALQQHSEVRVMVTLWREADRLMAGRVLEIGKLFPGLRLVPVITEQEERIYKKNSPSLSAQERKRRLDAADGYEVVSDILLSNRLPGYHQKFIESCDQIVYSTFRVPQYIRDDFARKVRMQKGRQPLVRYLMQGEQFPDPINIEPMLDLQRSVEYIRSSGFRLMSDTVPVDLLEVWLTNSELPRTGAEFTALEDVADMYRRKDMQERRFLLFKVFTFIYVITERLLTQPDDAACSGIRLRFRQFRRMLGLVAESRRRGIDIGCFDLLDTDGYGEIIKRFGWVDQPAKSAALPGVRETDNTGSADGKSE